MSYRHFAFAGLLFGCSLAHGSPTPDAGPVVLDDAGSVATPTALSGCLLGGGTLVEVASVHNNDTTDHGALLGIAVSPERQIAAAGNDGTLKLWTLEGFVGQIDTTLLTYGPELPAAPANDLLYHEGRVVIGDTQGVVSAWDLIGSMDVLGGTDPGVAITAVAIDDAHRWLAHADATGRVMVREIGGATVIGPIERGDVRDLAYMADGSLLVAGGFGLEIRDAADPTRALAQSSTPVDRVAIAGTRIVAQAGARTLRFEPSLAAPAVLADGTIASELATDGRVVLALDGAGTLHALDTEGRELARLATGHAGSAVLRSEPRGELLIAGFRDDARIAGYGCE